MLGLLLAVILVNAMAQSGSRQTTPPIITKVSPWFGGYFGGTKIQISGANFSPAGMDSQVQVFIGNNECVLDRYHSDDAVVFCTTPICTTTACLSAENWYGTDWVSLSVYVTTVEGTVSASTSFMYSGSWTPKAFQMAHTSWATSSAFIDVRSYTSSLSDISINFGGYQAKVFFFEWYRG